MIMCYFGHNIGQLSQYSILVVIFKVSAVSFKIGSFVDLLAYLKLEGYNVWSSLGMSHHFSHGIALGEVGHAISTLPSSTLSEWIRAVRADPSRIRANPSKS